MGEVMRREEKIKQFNISAINMQFEIAEHNKTYEDALLEEKFFDKYTITEEQEKQFKDWYIKTVRKLFRCTKKLAEHEYSWWHLNYGLKLEK